MTMVDAFAALALVSLPARAADPGPRLELRLLARVVQDVPQHYPNVTPPVLSPDGAVVMYGVRGTGRIVQRRAEDLKLVRTVESSIRYMNHLEWLEDGRVFACGYSAKVWSAGFERIEAGWEEGTGFSVHGESQRSGDVLAQFVSASSSNRKIIPGWISLRGLRGDAINARSRFDQESVKGDLSTDRYTLDGGLAPGGRYAVVAFRGQRRDVGIWKDFDRLVVYTVPGLQPVTVRNFKPKEQAPWRHDFIFAPDGKRFAVPMNNPKAIAVYVLPGLERAATLPYGEDYSPRSFSPDGRFLAICSDDGKKPGELLILDAQSDWSVVASTAAGGCGDMRFSADGGRLVTTGGDVPNVKSGAYEVIRVWELREREVPGAASGPAAPAFSGAVPLLR